MKDNSGVLLPIASLPARHGIGDFGPSCFKFIDWLKENNYKYWQILPLNPLGPGNSPYMSTCSRAIESSYICLDELKKDGLLSSIPSFNVDKEEIEYDKVKEFKEKYLKKAFKNFVNNGGMVALKKFKTRNPWVNDFATFEVFKKVNDMKAWNEWPTFYVDWYKNHTTPPRKLLEEIDYSVFKQYIALKQYKNVLSYARKNNIKFISDMPFYVGFDSVECWLHRDQFMIDENNQQTEVGGVPPDLFSNDGQLWGSPIYNFEKMKENNYELLVDRIGYLASMCDYLRLDHFRAFDTYYVIPGGASTAKYGEWKIGPRDEFFNYLYKKYPHTKLIAEDLGILFPSVLELRDRLNLPGMYVVEFNILNIKQISNDRLIVYSGTHDNETLYGWYLNLQEQDKTFLLERFNCEEKDLFDRIFDFCYNSPSFMSIFPLQDLLMLDNNARLNTPGTVGYPNFTWKLKDFSFTKKIIYPKSWMIR